ncbi:MAG: hypothetical protein ACYCYN_01120 [Solirubrobacteraceae bacterium]
MQGATRPAGRHAVRAVSSTRVSPTWIWLQIAIVLVVLAGIVIAIVRLA